MKQLASRSTTMLVLLIVVASGCDSQSPEVVPEPTPEPIPEPAPEPPEALRYFPLEVGNVWEYEEYIQTGDPFCPSIWSLVNFRRLEIEKEVMVQGKRYFQTRTTLFDLEGRVKDRPSWIDPTAVIGYDTSGVKVIQVDAETGEVNEVAASCELGAEDGDFAICGWEGDPPYFVSKAEEGTGRVEGGSIPGKYKNFESGDLATWYNYVLDVGPVSSGFYDCGGNESKLIYAKVGGQEIGTSRIPDAEN